MVLEIIRVLLTAVIAIAGIFIAYQQYKLHRQKVRSELYERRASVYRTVILTLQRVVTGIPKDDRDLFSDFFSGTAEAHFLFDSDVNEYLEEIKKRLIEASMMSMQQRDENFANDTDKKESLAKKREHLSWFRMQIAEAYKVFERYLKLDMKITTT